MIKFHSIQISGIADYDKIPAYIDNSLYCTDAVANELKARIGKNAKTILIEHPYSDLDYNSVYSSFYTKQHRPRPKDCYRVHFFSDSELTENNYRGFLVLRPSFIKRSLGRAQLDPRLLLNPGAAYVMQTDKFAANVAGELFHVSSFPWMAQETDVAICAHSATWSIIRYFSQKYPHHPQLLLDDVVQRAPLFLSRRIPSEGLNFLQISSILSQAGFHCLFLSKDVHGPDKFMQNIFTYIESGIPIIVGLKRKQHAIVLIGHGKIDHSKMPNPIGKYCFSSSMIDSLIGVDDNELPYLEIGAADNIAGYNINDLDYAIIPLYEKMFLPADIMLSKVTPFIEIGGSGFPTSPVIRPYLTSSRSLKRKTANSSDINDALKDIILSVEMPKFVWCVDVASPDEFRAGLNSGRIIIDATAGTYVPDPWLILHTDKQIVYYDRDDSTWRHKKEGITPYSLYQNNLKEV